METREKAKALIQEKDKLEAEISEIEALLNTLGVGRYGSLVDDEGFPLKDFDLFLIRSKRNELSCLINDHKALMKKIEAILPEALASEVTRPPAAPFARISRVAPGSLASRSGFCPGDLITVFGKLCKSDFTDAASLKQLLVEMEAHRAGKLVVRILRQNTEHILTIDLSQETALQLGCLADLL